MAHLGTRVSKLRREHKMSQQELAARVGVNQSFISKIESGEQPHPNAAVLTRLAKVLVCTTDYLVGMHEEDEEESERMPADAA